MKVNRTRNRRGRWKVLWELFFCFLKISSFTIGGGVAMLPLMMDQVVSKKGWMNDEEMVDCLAISQTIPGAVIINNSVFIGRKVGGVSGAIAAFFGTVLPSLICIIIVLLFLERISEIPQVIGFFKGALAAAAGLVAVACVRVGKGILKGPGDWVIALGGFTAVVFFHVSILWIIPAGCLAGALLFLIRRRRGRRGT
jgi:chromate transporter